MTAPDSRDSVAMRLLNDLHLIASQGETPDGDGVTVNVQLWAEKWADRLQALARGPQQAGGEVASVDALAQLIRAGDGNHRLGAGALAELLWPHYAALQAEVARLREDNALMKANIDSISAAVRSLFGAGSSGDAAIDAALNGGQE